MNRLASLIHRAAVHYGDREALAGPVGRFSFRDVDRLSNRLGHGLRSRLGLHKGDRVALLLGNDPAFVVADFALIKVGLVRVPVNPRLAPPEVEFIVRHARARVLITDADHAATAMAAVAQIEEPVTVVLSEGAGAIAGTCSLEDVLAAGDDRNPEVDMAPDDPYMIAYTSGTTGRPKGAVTTVSARFASLVNSLANECFVRPGDVMLHVTSLAHGSGTKVLGHFARGARNVLLPRFTPESFFDAVATHGVTTTWVVPTIVQRLVEAAESVEPSCHRTLRTMIYGGAPMASSVQKLALERFGQVFVQIYGLTEAPHPDLVLAKEDHGPDLPPGATGRPAVGVDLRLVDSDGRDVPAGEVGELLVAGPHVMAGYWNGPEATRAVLGAGWCRTGDLARIDERGYYHIVGRDKDMIISGGYNVYPREVEEVLHAHPQVLECVVYGVADRDWGERVEAAVVLRSGATTDGPGLIEYCRGRLASYKKPRRVVFLSELPRNASGKPDTRVLQRNAGHPPC